MVRRILGIGGLVIVLVLLVLLVKSCRAAQKEQAFKDYNRDVGALIQESDDESQSLFKLLETGGSSAVDIQSQVNGYAQEVSSTARTATSSNRSSSGATACGGSPTSSQPLWATGARRRPTRLPGRCSSSSPPMSSTPSASSHDSRPSSRRRA
jgi:hypothetical protein